MYKRKYKNGKPIKTIADFANSEYEWFMVYFGSWKPRHRSFLISWQYRTLEIFINNNRICEADKIEEI